MPANTPSREEAKEVLALYASLCYSLSEVQDRPFRALNTLQGLLGQSEDAFASHMRADLLGQEPPQDPLIDQFLETLLDYETNLPLAEEANALWSQYGENIRQSCKSLKPVTSSLRWLFTFPAKKEAARNAYAFLSSPLKDTLASLISRSAALPKSQKTLSALTKEEKDSLLSILTTKTAVGRKAVPLAEITALLEEAKKNQAALEKIHLQVKAHENAIEKAVEEICRPNVESFLADIPVEELNRDKSGIRVKLLRESGYETITDVYKASPFALSSIKGISEEMAYRIKDVADDYAKASQSNVRLRLSADQQTPLHTRLVKALYSYLQEVPPYEEVLKMDQEVGPGVKLDSQALEFTPSVFAWPFVPEEDQKKVKNAYTDLGEILAGDYGRAAEVIESTTVPKVTVTDEAAWEDFSNNPIPYLDVIERLCPGVLGGSDELYGLPEELAQEISGEEIDLTGLKCHLRKYQEWGVKYILHQKRVLLGDEMGLGKTIQAIASLVARRNTGATHFLVVCPASVLPNWCKEITEKSDLPVVKIHGKERYAAAEQWKKQGGVGVTTYEACPAITLAENEGFDFLVVDEAHYIKNPQAQRTAAVKALVEHSTGLLFMTGTALENRVKEMISLLDILEPTLALQAKGLAFMATTEQFQQKIAPVYYRRKREDVLTELPDLIQVYEWCSMTDKEEKIYENTVLNGSYADIRRVSWNVEDLKYSSKAQRLKELVEEAEEEGRKVLVFSFFLDTIQKVQTLLGEKCSQPINGSVTPAKRQQIIDDFDKAPAGSVLLAQILAGGTGLNIQSASVVILCEPQLKPSVENQAISRAYRMGQARNVLVYRLLCEDTVDEKLVEVLKDKQAIFDAFADPSAASALTEAEETAEVDTQTFGEIVQEERERIEQKRDKELPALTDAQPEA